MKNLADLNTFETSMSLRTKLKVRNEPYSLIYLHTYILPSSGFRGAKILQQTPVEKSQ